jgi:capsular exopolysaccharide synthesis family protein
LIARITKGCLRRRKLLGVGLFLLTAIVLGAAVHYHGSQLPPRFRTTGVVLLQARPGRSPVFDEFSPYRPVPVQLAILRSRSLAEAVVDNLQRESFEELATVGYRFLPRRDSESEPMRQRALAELMGGRVKFSPMVGGDSGSLVAISADASLPTAAVDIVNTYIAQLLARTQSFNVDDAKVSREFLERQVADVQKTLKASENALRQFTAAHGNVRVPEQSQASVARLSQTETLLGDLQANRKMSEARLHSLQEKARAQAKQIADASRASGPGPAAVPLNVQRLREQLTQLENNLLELRVTFTDEHPRVVRVKDRIADVQRQLQVALKETAASSGGAVPAIASPLERVNFAEQIATLESSLQAMAAQEEALTKLASTLRASLTGLSQSEQRYTALMREVDSTRTTYNMLADKLTAARIREQGEMKAVQVIDPPGPPTREDSARHPLFVLAALVGSVCMGVGVPAFLEWRDRLVESEDDVKYCTGLPALAVVPRLHRNTPCVVPALDTAQPTADAFLFLEGFRTLRAAVQLGATGGPVRTLLISSPHPNEGKSMTVANLGFVLAEAGYRVIVADTDFLRPTLTKKLNAQGSSLSDTVPSGSVEDSLTMIGDGLWVAGQMATLEAPARSRLATRGAKELVSTVAERADIVIFDSSPVLVVQESLFLASAVDGVILVAKAGSTRCRDLAKAKQILEGAGAKVLGTIINCIPVSQLRGQYTTYAKAYYTGA